MTAGVNNNFSNHFYINPQMLTSDVKEFAKTTDNMAKEILAINTPVEKYNGPVVFRHYHYYNDPFYFSPGPFWYPQPVVVVNDGYQGRRRKEDDNTAVIVGIAAAVVGGIALYTVGSGINKVKDANRELQETHEFQRKLDRYAQFSGIDQNIVYNAREVAHVKERICNRIKDSAVGDLALRVTLAASCIVALAGAFAGASALMTAGIIFNLVAVGGMLFKWGLDSSDTDNLRDAYMLRNRIEQLKTL